MLRQLIHIGVLLFSSITLFCQERYSLQNISEAQGLSDNRVTSFLKDRNGYMWIGTENGLNRYNGYSFTIYKPGSKQFAISNEHINDIEQDSTGRIFVSTNGGLNILDVNQNKLQVLRPDQTALPSDLIWDTQIDQKGRLWIAADNRDLCYYERDGSRFVFYPWKRFISELFPSRRGEYNSIQKIYPRSSHELWLGTTLGLFSFDMDSHLFQFMGGHMAQDFRFLYDDKANHKIFFVQEKFGLTAVDYNSNHSAVLRLEQKKYQWQHSASNFLFALEDKLVEIDPLHDDYVTASAKNQNYLSNFSAKINALYYDNDGLVWVGTADGVYCYDPKLNPFHFVTVMADSMDHTNLVRSVHYDESEKKYYITSPNYNSLFIVDRRSGAREVVSHADGCFLLGCSEIYEDRKKQLWLLGSRQVFRFDKAHHKLSVFNFPDKDFFPVVSMIEDADGNYWFGSSGHGLLRYNTATASFYKPPQEEFGSKMVFSFCNDIQHRAVWIGTFERGLYKYHLDSSKFERFLPNLRMPHRLHSALIYDIVQDHDGNIWAATYSGLSKYSYGKPADEGFTNFSVETGLPENIVYSMVADKKGNIWINTFKGLACLNKEGNIISTFGKTSGLQFNNFSNPLSVTSEGEIILGIENGFIHFNPDSLVFQSSTFPLVVSSWNASGKNINLSDTTRHFGFNYNQNDMQFEFAALSYSMPDQIQYEYKLEGWDKDWIHAGNSHFAKYTNLDFGHYKFRIRTLDHSGKPSTNEASLSFEIYPPFWKTWWFIGAAISSILILMYYWMRRFQKKIRTQKTLHSFTASMYEQNTMDDIAWDLAQNCVTKLGFVDCVVYIMDDEKNLLVQKAACGPKNPQRREILNPIEIPLGEGIVGHVAQSLRAEIIDDTSKDNRYIVDDVKRLSEISVPIVADGHVYGVIDSEHPSKNFFTRQHLYLLKEIAATCATRISKYITEQRLRTKIARDLHDDMGSALSSININSKMALQNADQNKIVQSYLQNIRDNSGNMLESMSDIVWAINPDNDTMEKLVIRMKEFAAEILEPLNITYSFEGEMQLEQVKLDLNKRKNLYLVFKEAVNNAAKYSSCTEVDIQLGNDERNICLFVKDNGKGFNLEQAKAGNGLRNMHERARAIRADLEIDSSIGNGTAIHLRLPIT